MGSSRPGQTARRRRQKCGWISTGKPTGPGTRSRTSRAVVWSKWAWLQTIRLKVGGVDVQPAHPLGHPVRTGARVERDAVLIPGLGDGDEHREAVFGNERIGRLAVGDLRRPRKTDHHPRRQRPAACLSGSAAGGAVERVDTEC